MNTLHNLQQQFSAAILGDHGRADNAGDHKNTFSIEEKIVDGTLSGKRRLNIYRNNVNISLRDALKSIYPVANKLVGDDFFNVAAHEYIKLHPSLSGNLHDFGNFFADFIGEFRPARALVYLPDVARLEWAYHQVFHAADGHAFDIESLQKVSPADYGELFFKLTPACALIESPFPILRIWQSNQETDTTQPNENTTISLDEGGDMVLVLRANFDIQFQLISPCEYNFLKALLENKNFFDACDIASQAQANCNVGDILQKFILSNAIVDFEINN